MYFWEVDLTHDMKMRIFKSVIQMLSQQEVFNKMDAQVTYDVHV